MEIPAKTLCFLTLGELSELLHKREVTSVETTSAVLDHIHKLNPTLRAYLTILDDSACARPRLPTRKSPRASGADRFMAYPSPSRISAGPRAFRPPARARC